VEKPTALAWLAEGVAELGEHAKKYNVPLILEPINRYETNLLNTIESGLALIRAAGSENIRLLADLFHMNIEEVDIAASLKRAGAKLGHVHFVDSNRRPAGFGHLDFTPIAAALREINYSGFASAEALPYPDPHGAARQTIEAFRKL
jgi:sugar phosphate isomerase/epimerase